MLKINKIRRFASNHRLVALLVSATFVGLSTLPLLGLISPRLKVGALAGLVVLLVVVLALLTAAVTFMDLGAVETDEAEIARVLTPDRQAQDLIQRWIVRARWYRYVGGAAGLGFALGWTGHFVLFGMFGIMVGAVLSESARVGKPIDGPRTAQLTSRPMRRYISGGQQYGLYLIAGLGVVAGVVSILDNQWGLPLYGSLAVVLLVAVVLSVQWRVVVRSRPALPEPIRHADDLLRYLANTRSLADPATALGLALLAETFGTWAGPEESYSLGGAVEFVCFVLALGVWGQNRRLGLDRLNDLELVRLISHGSVDEQLANRATVSSAHDS